MIVFIIIFFITIIILFGMVTFRAWEIKTGKVITQTTLRKIFPEIYFRQTEKIMLYLAKHTIHWIVLVTVKYWFIFLTKTKRWSNKKLPKIQQFLGKLSRNTEKIKKLLAHQSVVELKHKIRYVKEKVRREHEKTKTNL